MNRQTLIDKCDERRRDHGKSSLLHKKLVNDVCRQINEECDKADAIDHLAHSIATDVDDLAKAHSEAPAYVAANYELLMQAYTRLSFVLSAIQPKQIAAE